MIKGFKIILSLLAVTLMASGCFKPRDYDYSRWYEDPEGGAGGRTVKVMSFNLRSASSNDPGERSWASRRPAVKAMLKDQNPLVMGVTMLPPSILTVPYVPMVIPAEVMVPSPVTVRAASFLT